MPDLSILLEALAFGIAVAFILIGLAGIVVPLLPGILLIWLTVLAYAIVDKFEAIGWVAFAAMTILAIVAGTADIWMSLLGAKKSGAARRAMVFGMIGGIIGFFFFGSLLPIIGNLIGGILGYAIGIFLGQYHKFRDWDLARKASFGGVIGWGVATITQFAGGLLILLIFVWQVLSY
jgi:hypothetical protein